MIHALIHQYYTAFSGQRVYEPSPFLMTFSIRHRTAHTASYGCMSLGEIIKVWKKMLIFSKKRKNKYNIMKCKITPIQVLMEVSEFYKLNFISNMKEKADLDYSFKIRCLHGFKD